MKMVFGLGNPGREFIGTRHNVGYDTLAALASEHAQSFVLKDKFKAEIAEITVSGEKLVLVRPVTFYNSAGESYRAVLDFYKFDPADTLVVHDELALPFGTVRVREGGSDAGNNGIKSVNTHGGENSMRLRVGVSNDSRSIIGDTDFVLGKFTPDELTDFQSKVQATLYDLIHDFAAGQLAITSHKHE
jgi:PTH1 family peptidyl-tRNA hydrolase